MSSSQSMTLRCPLCNDRCGPSVDQFSYHFTSKHNITVSSRILATNLLKNQEEYNDTLLVLKDFMNIKKTERELRKKCEDRENELTNILRILQSKDTPMDYYPFEDSNNNGGFCDFNSYSDTYKNIILTLQEQHYENSSATTSGIGTSNSRQMTLNSKSRLSANISPPVSSSMKNPNEKPSGQHLTSALRKKVMDLEKNLKDQVRMSENQNLEILDLMGRLDNSYDQKEMCVSEINQLKACQNTMNTTLRSLQEDNSLVTGKLRCLDNLNKKYSEEIIKTISENSKKLNVLFDETETIVMNLNSVYKVSSEPMDTDSVPADIESPTSEICPSSSPLTIEGYISPISCPPSTIEDHSSPIP